MGNCCLSCSKKSATPKARSRSPRSKSAQSSNRSAQGRRSVTTYGSTIRHDDNLAAPTTRSDARSKSAQPAAANRDPSWQSGTADTYGSTVDNEVDENAVMKAGDEPSESVQRSSQLKCKNKYSPGLNIEGICTRRGCTKYKEEVVCDAPFNPFDLAMHAPDVKCPHCGAFTEPAVFTFYRCKWTMEGKKFVHFSQIPELYSEDGVMSDRDPPTRIPINQNGNWLRLTITVEV